MSTTDSKSTPTACLRVIDGGRASLERELLWLVALDGNKGRQEVLTRRLGVAANHNFALVTPIASTASR